MKDYDQLWKSNAIELWNNGAFPKIKLENILKVIKNYNINGNIIEIGCGGGYILESLNDPKNNLYALDISKTAIFLTRKKVNIKKDFILDISKKINIKKKFNLVICSEVLEHIENDNASLREICKLVKKNRYLLLTVPLWQKYFSKKDILSGHLRRYDPSKLIDTVKKLNFKNVKSYYYGGVFFRFIQKYFLGDLNSMKRYRFLQKMRRLPYYFYKIEDTFFKFDKCAQGIFLFQKLN